MLENIITGLLCAGVTGLFTWVYRVNDRVTTLEAERVNLSNLDKLMTARYESLEKLIDVKFQHLQELVKSLSAHQLAQPRRRPVDE